MKSTDGGSTWNPTGLTWTSSQGRVIHRLIIHPTTTSILFAATSNGIYKTTDSGTTWTQVKTGEHLDIEFHPTNPSVIYATTATRVVKSTDTGTTWANLTNGLPATSSVGRAAVAITAANSNVVYALFADASDYSYYGLYKSSDQGSTWTQQSSSPNLFGYESNGSDAGGQAWYDMALAVSPTSENTVFAGGINIWKSTTGGSSWSISAHWTGSGAPYVHADIHDLIFQPGSGSVVYSGNDGGVFKSTTTGTSWSDKSDGLTIHQIYRLGLSVTNSNLALVGSQDNGTSLYSGGSWDNVYGGDGMECIIDWSNANIMYASMYYGYLFRSSNGGGNFSDISPSAGGNGAWVTPYVIHPSTNTTLLAGYTEVYKTTNSGTAWSAISSNLTGGTSTLKSLAVAPSNANYIYAATYSNIYKTISGGTSWSNITGTVPTGNSVTYIAVHPSDPNVVFVTLSGYSSGNKVFKTVNGGTNWTNISVNLPNIPVNCIAVENNGYDALYVGTDLGVYYTNSTMSTWISFNDGLPNVIVNELEIHSSAGKIRAATYGRGLWSSDLMTVSTVQYDAGIISVIWPSGTICDSTTLSPLVRLKNMGINTLTSVTINYTIDANNYSYNWAGSLATGSQTDVQLPSVTVAAGNHTVQVSTSNPNGNTDGNTTNDASSGSFATGTTPPSVITSYPYFTDFESCVSWSHNVTAISNGNVNPNPADIWELGAPAGTLLNTPYSGTKVYSTNLDGNYDYSSYARLVSPVFDFINLSSPVVQFRMACDLEFEWDALYFEYSTDGGTTWTKLGTASDPNWYNSSATGGGNPPGALMTGAQWTGTDATWKLYQHSLSSLAGQPSVMLRFNLASDEYVEQEGIVVDDFTVSGLVNSGDEMAANAVHIYPQPASDFVFIEFPSLLNASKEIRLLNPVGQEISKFHLRNNENRLIINYKNYTEGLFLLEIRYGDSLFWKKLVISGKH
ncbi:MAG: hypothetical protein HYY40_14785 [Bacteroidetes bacterium]|nr:hypothetical protein [Bacteroidota bacterium]